MPPLEQLKKMLNEKYVEEDGDSYVVERLPGLSEREIDELALRLPGGHLPPTIVDLLTFARGFSFYGLETVTFDGVDQFGFESIFPSSVQLAGDGFGNFWILDIDKKGHWGAVFYVCHDPAVIVRHSESLEEFLCHIDESGKEGSRSHLDKIHDQTVFDIWKQKSGLIESRVAIQSSDEVLKEFAAKVGDDCMIADLRANRNGSGFAWGKFGSSLDLATRHDSEFLWAFKIKEKGKNWLAKIFNR